MPRSLHRISDVAEQCAISTRTLRYYEERGLLASERLPNGRRAYTDAHVAQLKTIVRLKRCGLSLDEIEQILTTEDPEERNRRAHWLVSLGARRLISQIAELEANLEEAKAYQQLLHRRTAISTP